MSPSLACSFSPAARMTSQRPWPGGARLHHGAQRPGVLGCDPDAQPGAASDLVEPGPPAAVVADGRRRMADMPEGDRSRPGQRVWSPTSWRRSRRRPLDDQGQARRAPPAPAVEDCYLVGEAERLVRAVRRHARPSSSAPRGPLRGRQRTPGGPRRQAPQRARRAGADAVRARAPRQAHSLCFAARERERFAFGEVSASDALEGGERGAPPRRPVDASPAQGQLDVSYYARGEEPRALSRVADLAPNA